jgi:hypothetical protein
MAASLTVRQGDANREALKDPGEGWMTNLLQSSSGI